MHPDYPCACYNEIVVKNLLISRKAESPAPAALGCYERRCADPTRFVWYPNLCQCGFKKPCPTVCHSVNPDTCECTNQNEVDKIVNEYHQKWNNIEMLGHSWSNKHFNMFKSPSKPRKVKSENQWIKQA